MRGNLEMGQFLYISYVAAICIWHMHMAYAYGICIWHMHMQETQNAEKYSLGNESGLGGPVLAQIWSESIPAGSRKPLKPLAGSKTAIKKSKNIKNNNFHDFPHFPIFSYMGALLTPDGPPWAAYVMKLESTFFIEQHLHQLL